MKLLVDAGNSRIKLATLSPAGLRPVGARSWRVEGAPAALRELAGGLREVSAVWAANVAGEPFAEALAALAAERWAAPVHLVAVARAAHGVRCGYDTPDALGVDRWMALIGARRAVPGAVCIADCGTAVTLDALDAGGRHLGGAIAPGRRLMREALARGTAALPRAPDEVPELLAGGTAAGIAAGCDHAVAALIERFRGEVAQRTGATPELLMTGGDAPVLAPLLAGTPRVVPDLVLRGLAVVAEAAAP